MAASYLGITESFQGSIKDAIGFELDYDEDNFDIDAITDEITTEVENRLPDYLTIDRNKLLLDRRRADERDIITTTWLKSLRDKIQEIDFEAIAQKHAR